MLKVFCSFSIILFPFYITCVMCICDKTKCICLTSQPVQSLRHNPHWLPHCINMNLMLMLLLFFYFSKKMSTRKIRSNDRTGGARLVFKITWNFPTTANTVGAWSAAKHLRWYPRSIYGPPEIIRVWRLSTDKLSVFRRLCW